MPRGVMTVAQILTALAEGPPRIAEFTARLTTAKLHAVPGPGEWSANEVLAHLRSCADVWGNCIVTILHQDRPTIRAVNPRTWIERTDYPEQRNALLQVLEPLGPEVWLRSARVTGAGKVLERTIHSYAEWMAEHERPHLQQIKRIAGTMRK